MIMIIGLLAGVLTTSALLPQVVRIWHLKEARDISSYAFEMLSVGVLLWLIYGVLTRDVPLIIANALTLILALTMLALKFRYK